MKLRNNFPILLLVLVLLLIPLCTRVSAADTSGTLSTGQTWEFDDATGTLTVTGTGELPDYPYSASLESQAPWKVWATAIKTIVLSEGITSTGKCTFHFLENLTRVELPNTLDTIDNNAFSGAKKLQGITLPTTVTHIGNSAFKDCIALSDITLPAGLNTIGNRAFNGCNALVSVKIPASVTKIDSYAFGYCSSLREVTIAGAPTISDEIFEHCNNLKLLRFCDAPPSFAYNSLSGVDAESYYPKNNSSWEVIVANTYGGVVDWFASDDPANAQLPGVNDTKSGVCGTSTTWSLTSGVLTISGSGQINTVGWKRYANEIKKAVIQNGITELPAEAFMFCINLKNVNLPNTLTSLNANTFSGCTSLSSIILPSGLTAIEWYTFQNCTALKEIVLPSGITYIGEYAFFCAGLEKITLSDTLTEIQHHAFAGCSKLKEIRFPASLKTLGDCSFSGCTSLRKIYFSGNPPKVYNFTFQDVDATAYYPAGNTLWENGGMAFHSGRITDKAYSEQTSCNKHVYGDWTVTLKPSAEQAGEKKRVCTVCGYTQTAVIPASEQGATNPTTQPSTTAPPATDSQIPPVTNSTSPPTTTTAPTASNAGTDVSEPDHTGLIIAISLGVVLIVGIALWFFLRKRK